MKIKYKVNKNNHLTVITGKEKLTVEGEWQLDKDNNLDFIFRKTKTQSGGEKLFFRTKLIKAKADSLAFSLDTQEKRGSHQVQWLEFKGKWQADKYNRLQFLIKKKPTGSRPLTLQGSWKVKQNTLVYTYKKSSPGTKTKQSHDLYFKGYWQINQKNRLSYILDAKKLSQFDFRAYLETPNLIGKRGRIKYRLGIGAKTSKFFKAQVVSIYGVWKFHRKGGLSLVVAYADSQVKAIDFGVFVRMNKKTKITLGLVNRKRKDIGISLTFNKSFLNSDAQWFLKMLVRENRPAFNWGVSLPW